MKYIIYNKHLHSYWQQGEFRYVDPTTYRGVFYDNGWKRYPSDGIYDFKAVAFPTIDEAIKKVKEMISNGVRAKDLVIEEYMGQSLPAGVKLKRIK